MLDYLVVASKNDLLDTGYKLRYSTGVLVYWVLKDSSEFDVFR